VLVLDLLMLLVLLLGTCLLLWLNMCNYSIWHLPGPTHPRQVLLYIEP
jgi:hypothetical protein